MCRSRAGRASRLFWRVVQYGLPLTPNRAISGRRSFLLFRRAPEVAQSSDVWSRAPLGRSSGELIAEQLNASRGQVVPISFSVGCGDDLLDRVAKNSKIEQATLQFAFRLDHVACRDRVGQAQLVAVVFPERDGRFEWPIHHRLPITRCGPFDSQNFNKVLPTMDAVSRRLHQLSSSSTAQC